MQPGCQDNEGVGADAYALVPRISAKVKGGQHDEACQLFDALAREVTPGLLRLATSKVSNAHDAGEIAHNVLVGLWQGIVKNQESLAKPRGYVNTILRNEVADYWESKRGSGEHPPRSVADIGHMDFISSEDADGQSTDPAEIAERHDTRRAVRAAVDALEEPDRTIVKRIQEGKSLRETAAELDLGLGQVRYRFEKFAATLRNAIGDDAGRTGQ